MAKIIYKEGHEGQNKLSGIKGIEIELLNGQKALIYPKYAERKMLNLEQKSRWAAAKETEAEALKVKDTSNKTKVLLNLRSPAAEWVSQFNSDNSVIFYLPSLVSALEIQCQKAEIDTLAETIEGADLLKCYNTEVWSCSRKYEDNGWCVLGDYGYTDGCLLTVPLLVVPTMIC